MHEDELQFHFTFNIRKRQDAGPSAPDTVINGLTFVLAQNSKGLESLITREFHADPNLHKNPNVNLVGDFSTEGSSAVQFQWSWTWRPPSGYEERGNNGWRTACSVRNPEADSRCMVLILCSLSSMTSVPID